MREPGNLGKFLPWNCMLCNARYCKAFLSLCH